MLEKMALDGNIFRVKKEGKRMYRAYQFLLGTWEFHLNNLDREFCELFQQYLPYVALSLAMAKTKQMRIIPLESSLETVKEVAPYNKVREVIKKEDFIVVANCICRKEAALTDHKCDRPNEVCLGFGDIGRYYLENNMARQIDVDEALHILDVAEESGLVLTPTNSQKIEAICCCCPCCCASLKYIKSARKPARFVQSYYKAEIDVDKCTACEECLDRCQIAAIRIDDETSEVIDGRCIGCGLCISTCPEEAIQLKEKPHMPIPPETFEDTLQVIKAERTASRKR